MQERGETTYTLINKHGTNPRTVNNLKHNKSITMYTLERLCQILQCQAEHNRQRNKGYPLPNRHRKEMEHFAAV